MTELGSHIVLMPLIGDWAKSQVCRKSGIFVAMLSTVVKVSKIVG